MSTTDGHIKLAIGVPSNGMWRAEFGRSLTMAIAEFMNWREPWMKSKYVSLVNRQGSMLVQLRHNIVRDAMQWGATHILFLDSDMQFPSDIIQRMMRRKKPIVAANCTTRGFPVYHTALDLDGKRIDSRKKTGLEKVQHVGLAVMLIEADLFKKTLPPYFLMDWVPALKAYCGEDTYFCHKMQEELGVDIWVDHKLSHEIGHVGSMPFTEKLIEVNSPVLKAMGRSMEDTPADDSLTKRPISDKIA